MDCRTGQPVLIEPCLRGRSPENGNIRGSVWRLSANWPRILRIWESRDRASNCKSPPLAGLSAAIRDYYSEHRTAWLGREDSGFETVNRNLTMETGRSLKLLSNSKPSYFDNRINGRSTEAWIETGVSKHSGRLCRVGSPELELQMPTATGLNCQQVRPENTWPWANWRRERNWGRTFSTQSGAVERTAG